VAFHLNETKNPPSSVQRTHLMRIKQLEKKHKRRHRRKRQTDRRPRKSQQTNEEEEEGGFSFDAKNRVQPSA
jgi:hypothetical protein